MLLVFFGLPALIVLIATLCGLGQHARHRLREGDRPRLASPKPWALGCLAASSAAFLTFGYADGAYSPGLFPDKTCLARMGSRTFPESSSHFPFSTICSGVEIVPAWINPTLIILSTVAAVALLALPLAYVIRRFPLTSPRTHDI